MNYENPYREFSKVVENTHCPYSDQKSAMGPVWDMSLTWDENIATNAKELQEFFAVFIPEKLHGYVMEVRTHNNIKTLEEFGKVFNKILITLNEYDPLHSNCLRQKINSLSWQFQFAGERTFITTFAPCYQPLHPRYSYSANILYLFFQPEKSFAFCGVNSGNRESKELARKAFEKAGRPYDGALIDKRIEAWLYILPAEVGDNPIEWWKE